MIASLIEDVRNLLDQASQGDPQSWFLLAALYVLLMCGYSAVYQYLLSRWPTVSGTLTQAGLRKFAVTDRVPSQQSYVADALYHYEMNGKQYEGSRVSPWVIVASYNARAILQRQLQGISGSEEGRVDVHFNPRNPAKSFLIVPGTASQISTLALGLLPLALYWIRYHSG